MRLVLSGDLSSGTAFNVPHDSSGIEIQTLLLKTHQATERKMVGPNLGFVRMRTASGRNAATARSGLNMNRHPVK